MIFNNYFFDNFDKTEIVRDKMNGLNDPENINFDLIASYPMINKDSKDDYGEKEYIDSYLNGAKILCNSIPRSPSIKIIYNYSLNLPIIFLCRHSIELALKFYIKKYLNKEPLRNHKINELWEELKRGIIVNTIEEEACILKNMDSFLEIILSIDDNGTKLRYSKQGNKIDSQENLRFVNVNKIVELTDKFIKQLENMKECQE